MEEECGNTLKSLQILRDGLYFLPLSEPIFIKAIKTEERLKNYDNVRELLGSLRDISIEKTWKMILEGALFEGRVGNKKVARRAFEYLAANC